MIYGDNSFNRFVNLDSLEFRIIDFLAKSDNKYADNLFKVLKYNTEDCLLKPTLSYAERIGLLYTNNGETGEKRVFMNPFQDDSTEEQSAQLRIYVDSIVPQNHIISTVNIAIETIVHNKIANIYGEASEFNPRSNPSELDENKNPIIIYKSRESVLLKSVIAALNGVFVAGVGQLQFNSQIKGSSSQSNMSLFNGKKFFGHKTIMSTMLSGNSSTPGDGY